jgi:hypothetical protein
MDFIAFKDMLVQIGLVIFAHDKSADGSDLTDTAKVKALLILLHQAVAQPKGLQKLAAFRSVAMVVKSPIIHPNA